MTSPFRENPTLSTTMIFAKNRLFLHRFQLITIDRTGSVWHKIPKLITCKNLTRNHFKSCFIILLGVLRLNPSPIRLQLTCLALFSTHNLTTSIVFSVLTVLLLLDLRLILIDIYWYLDFFPLLGIFYVVTYYPICWWVFLWKSFEESLFYFQKANGFVICYFV